MLCVHSVPLSIHELVAVIEFMLKEINLFFLDGELVFVDLFKRLDLQGRGSVVMGQFGPGMSVRNVVRIVEVFVAVLKADPALVKQT